MFSSPLFPAHNQLPATLFTSARRSVDLWPLTVPRSFSRRVEPLTLNDALALTAPRPLSSIPPLPCANARSLTCRSDCAPLSPKAPPHAYVSALRKPVPNLDSFTAHVSVFALRASGH